MVHSRRRLSSWCPPVLLLITTLLVAPPARAQYHRVPGYPTSTLPARPSPGAPAVVMTGAAASGPVVGDGSQWRCLDAFTVKVHVVTCPPYNAKTDGATDARTAFNAAQNDAGGTGTVFVPTGTYRFASPITLSSQIRIDHGGLLKPDMGITVTITGPLAAGRYKVFDNALASQGTISFRRNSYLTEIYPEWWGAVGDAGYASSMAAATDSTAAFQAGIAAATIATADLDGGAVNVRQASPYMRKIRLNAGAMYKLTAPVQFRDLQGLWFDGNGAWLTWGGDAVTPMFDVRGCSHCKWRDFTIVNDQRFPLFAGFLVRKFNADSINMTEATWERVEIQGNAGSIGFPWLVGFGDTTGNNEFHRWESCRASDYADAAVAITSGVNAKQQVFSHSHFSGDSFGLRGVTSYAKYHHLNILAIGRSDLTAAGGTSVTNDLLDRKYGAGPSRGSNAIAIPDGHTTGVIATGGLDVQSPYLPLTGFTHAVMWVKSRVPLNSGDYQVILRDAESAPLATLDIPAVAADVWTYVAMPLPAPAPVGVDAVAINVAVDKGANTLKLQHLRARRGGFPGVSGAPEAARASFHWKNGWVGNHLISDFQLTGLTDATTIEGADSENTPRQVVVAALEDDLTLALNSHPLGSFPVRISGFRANSVRGSTATDGDSMIFDSAGPVTISDSTFRSDYRPVRFRIYGGAGSTGASTIADDTGLLTLNNVQFRDSMIPPLSVKDRISFIPTNLFPAFDAALQVDAGDAGWASVDGHVSVTHATSGQREGLAYTSIAVGAAATTGEFAEKTLSVPVNLNGKKELWIWIFGGVAYAGGEVQIVLKDSGGATVATLPVPKWQVSGNADWGRMRLPLPSRGLHDVKKVVVKMMVDRGADATLGVDDVIATDLGEVFLESADTAVSATHANVVQTNDTTDYQEGAASLKLTSTAVNVTGSWATRTYPQPLNLGQKDRVAYWIKSTHAFADSEVRLQLKNTGGRVLATAPAPALVADTWTRVAFKSSTATLTDVKALVLDVAGAARSPSGTRIWLDEVRATNGPAFFTRKRVVSFSTVAAVQSAVGETVIDNLVDVAGTMTRATLDSPALSGVVSGAPRWLSGQTIPGVTTSGKLVRQRQTLTVADNGAGTNATATLTPTHAYIEIDCQDAHGCDVTMGKGSAVEGEDIRIVNISAHTVNFGDTAGVSELAGAFAAGPYDAISMIYEGTRWVETARSNN